MILSRDEKQDKLDMLLTLACQGFESAEYNDFLHADTSNVKFSEAYYRRRNSLIRKYRQKPHLTVFKKFVSSAAIVVLAVMSAAFITIMSVTALREAVFKVIVEWYDEYISIRYEQPFEEETDTEQAEETMQGLPDETSVAETVAVVIPTEILEFKKPTYVPDGVDVEELPRRGNVFIVDYYTGDILQVSYRQRLYTEDAKLFDSEGLIIETIEINGSEAIVLYSDEKKETTIIWDDGEYVYRLLSYLDIETSLKIAQSVR